MPEQLLYEINQATAIVPIGRSKLYELLAAGEIESVTIGRRRFIPHDALVAFVESLRRKPAA